MRISTLSSLFLAIGLLSTNLAIAEQTTRDFQTNATLSSSCQFNIDSINFGTVEVSSAMTQTTNTVNVLCSRGVTFAISFDSGLYGTNGTPTSRKMKGSIATNTDYLTYNLRKNSFTGPFLSTSGSNRLMGSSNGVYQAFTVFATLDNSYVMPDSYSDTSTMTITY